MRVINLLFVFCAACGGSQSPSTTSPAPTPAAKPTAAAASKQQTCPDAWYDNAMPGPGAPSGQYMVIKGKRVELDQVDVDWVKANCPVKAPQTVQ